MSFRAWSRSAGGDCDKNDNVTTDQDYDDKADIKATGSP